MNKIICAMGLICMMVFGACEKSVSHLCGGDSPAISLPWLRQEITRLSTSTQCNSISRSTYKEKTVFISPIVRSTLTAFHIYMIVTATN